MEEAERNLDAEMTAPDALTVLAELNKKKELKAVNHFLIDYIDFKKNLYVVKFEGVNYRDQAEALRDVELLVPESDRPELDDGEFHVLDLVGLEVFLQDTGESIGRVVDLISVGNDLLEIAMT